MHSMNSKRIFVAIALVSVMVAGFSLAQIAAAGQGPANSQWMAVKRNTLAVRYENNDGTAVNMTGSAIDRQAMGKAEVKHNHGRTRIKLEIENLGNPQAIGPYYTTFVLWAIAPEGQADNLAELPVKTKIDIDVTTNFQTFGLIITAEPHSAVKLPSPAIVAENTLRRGTEGGIQTSRIEYSGDPGMFYANSWMAEPALTADYETPLLILGARRSVETARRAGARHYAETELRDAEIKLAALEQIWPNRRHNQEKYTGPAHDIMRMGENARAQAVERRAKAQLADERRDAVTNIAQAKDEAGRALNEAGRANERADAYRDAMTRAQSETAAARERVERAQSETDKAKANEDLARAEADRSRLEAERSRMETQQVKEEQSALQQRLFISLSEILETRREARGLIVNLSDVLFDFNQASLKPAAREKLGKLAGILLAYTGSYRMEIEGHTDSVGSQDYNQKLSEDRAEAVHDFLIRASVAGG